MPRVSVTFFVSVSHPPLQLFFREVFQKLPLKMLTTVSAGSAGIPATAQSQPLLRAAPAGKSGRLSATQVVGTERGMHVTNYRLSEWRMETLHRRYRTNAVRADRCTVERLKE